MLMIWKDTAQAAHFFFPPSCLTGGTVLAAQVALQRGLACSTAGGTHHAFPSFGSGFCLLNDLAVTAKYLISSPKRKVLIVDLDVHQVDQHVKYTICLCSESISSFFNIISNIFFIRKGDGTAFIFKEEPRVFTFSVHCGKNFPLRKQQSDLDISVEVGLEDKEYLSTGTLTQAVIINVICVHVFNIKSENLLNILSDIFSGFSGCSKSKTSMKISP